MKKKEKNSSIKITKEGIWFAALTVAVGVAAINTGINLLFLILGLMLSFILASGVLSKINLSKIKFERITPTKILLNQEFNVKLKIINNKRFIPSYSLIIQDSALRIKPSYFEGKFFKKKLYDYINLPLTYCMNIPSKNESIIDYPVKIDKRGLYSFENLTIFTQFPFGFFKKYIKKDLKTDIVVYPKIGTLHQDNLAIYDQNSIEGISTSMKEGTEEFYGLREYRIGDNPKWIHWRSSAKLSKEMVMEFELQQGKLVSLILDTFIEEGNFKLFEDLLEKGISFTATLAYHYISKGYPLALSCYNPSFTLHPHSVGEEHLNNIMKTLAILEPTSKYTVHDLLKEIDPKYLYNSLIIVILLKKIEETSSFYQKLTEILQKYGDRFLLLNASDPYIEMIFNG